MVLLKNIFFGILDLVSQIDFKRKYSRKYYDYAVNEVEFSRLKNKNTIAGLKLKTKSILASGLMKISK